MDSGEYKGPVCAHNSAQALKLGCMHAVYLHANAHILAKSGHIREIKVSMESGEHARPP